MVAIILFVINQTLMLILVYLLYNNIRITYYIHRKNKMKTYRIHGSTGARFSFNAKDKKDAESKLWSWLRYHSMTDIAENFEVKEITDTSDLNDLHNEWVS